jgi:hypothetical protein
MNRENRYIVIKRKDAEAYLTSLELNILIGIGEQIAKCRRLTARPELKCVVVESDWPEYEPTWAAIGQRVDGATPRVDGPGDKGWIAVADRLPEGEVLAWEGTGVDPFLSCTGPEEDNQAAARCARFGITHWMPMPEPPIPAAIDKAMEGGK